MKISDKELRDRTMLPGRNIYAVADVLAEELLTVRAEVRRLRKAIRVARDSNFSVVALDSHLTSALARRGGRKGKR